MPKRILEIEEIIAEFNRQIYPANDYPTYGDGHYCKHHPDDPAHGESCYEHPLSNWLRDTLTKRDEAIVEHTKHVMEVAEACRYVPPPPKDIIIKK